MPEWAESLGTEPSVRATAVVLGAIIVAYVAEIVMKRGLLSLAARTTTTLDDEIVEILRRPVFLSVIFGGLAFAASILEPGELTSWAVVAALKSLTIIVWSTAAFRIGALLLGAMARRDNAAVVRPATLPVFLIFLRLTVIALSLYFVFLAWRIDLTAWMASAGILGIALGFAAKDTLANLFAGVFILADAPYKVGDTIVVDNELRGRVIRIGMRSTRLLTRDDVEITIPNAVIGNARVTNEAGGPQIAQRVRVKVFAAYGSDVDRVRATLTTCADGVKNVCATPVPQVRFRELGDSGLRFELLVWVDESAERGRVIDEITTRIYKAFRQAGIEIPYNKLDVYLKGQAAEPLSTTRPAASPMRSPPLG